MRIGPTTGEGQEMGIIAPEIAGRQIGGEYESVRSRTPVSELGWRLFAFPRGGVGFHQPSQRYRSHGRSPLLYFNVRDRADNLRRVLYLGKSPPSSLRLTPSLLRRLARSRVL